MKFDIIIQDLTTEWCVVNDKYIVISIFKNGQQYSSEQFEMAHLNVFDEDSIRKWVEMNQVSISETSDVINLDFTLEYIGSNHVKLNRKTFGDLLDTYNELEDKYKRLYKRYTEIYWDIDNISIGCLRDIGQGDYVCRGDDVREEIDEIILEHNDFEMFEKS